MAERLSRTLRDEGVSNRQCYFSATFHVIREMAAKSTQWIHMRDILYEENSILPYARWQHHIEI